MCDNKLKRCSNQIKIKKKTSCSIHPIYISAFLADFLYVTVGNMMAWSSSTIPKLQSNNTDINPLGTPITTIQISMIASLSILSILISNLIVPKITNNIGRKKTMALSSAIFVISLTCIAFAKHIYIIFFFLLTTGFGSSCAFLNVYSYNGEIAVSNNRGKLGCFVGVVMPFALLVSYIIGPLTSIKVYTLICAAPAFLHLILSQIYLIESPVYLAQKGRKVEALSALKQLRKNESYKCIETEYLNIIDSIRSQSIDKRHFFDLFRDRLLIKALLLNLTLFMGQELSGIITILSFMSIIFSDVCSTLSGNAVGVIVSTIKLIMFLTASHMVEKLGRRPLMLFSSLTCSISMFLMSVCFYLKEIQSPFIKNNGWLLIALLVLFIIGYSLGLGPIPIPLATEIFPNDLRTVGLGFVGTVTGLALFLANFSFPLLSKAFGISACMLVHSLTCLLVFFILFFFLPETKGKNLKEIEEMLSKNMLR